MQHSAIAIITKCTSVYQQFNYLKSSILIIGIFITTNPQFYILSYGLVECRKEPWHAGVRTPRCLLSSTLLPIPQRVSGVEMISNCAPWVHMSTCLTVVVIANIGRDCALFMLLQDHKYTWWWRVKYKINFVSISPDKVINCCYMDGSMHEYSYNTVWIVDYAVAVVDVYISV